MLTAERADRGFALLSVIWLLLLVGILGSMIVLQSVSMARDARDARNRVRARIAAENAFEIVAWDVARNGPRSRWGGVQNGNHEVSTEILGASASVASDEEARRIDLASDDLGAIARWSTTALSAAEANALLERLALLRRAHVDLSTQAALLAQSAVARALSENEGWTVYSGRSRAFSGPADVTTSSQVNDESAKLGDVATNETSTVIGVRRFRVNARSGTASIHKTVIARISGGATPPDYIYESM